MKVLVTGHHGYIGSVTAPLLAASGHDVTGLDTLFYRGCDLTPGAAIPALERVRDVTPEDLRGYEAIVHLAALSNDPLGDIDPALTYEINFHATVSLARAAKEVASTASCSRRPAACGASEDEHVTEDAPLKPLTAYAESKVRSEEAIAELADGDFSPVSTWNATAYGASPRLRLDIVLNNLVGLGLHDGRGRILSDGTPWRPLDRIEDLPRDGRAPGGTPRDHPRRGVQRGRPRGELPGARAGRDRAGCRSGQHGRVRRLERPGPHARTGSTSESCSAPCRASRRCAERATELRSSTPPIATASLTFDDFDGSRFTRLKRLQELRGEGKLGPDLRWRE